jgi:hypothetical protein
MGGVHAASATGTQSASWAGCAWFEEQANAAADSIGQAALRRGLTL